jgi:hypothetical protein
MSRNIAGFRTAQFTPERVLRDKGLSGRATVQDLAKASAAFDQTNPGYLSEAELRQGADKLLSGGGFSSDDRVDGFRFSSKVMGDVQSSVPRPNTATNTRFTATEILMAASHWDDGNGYLNKKELTAAALELQMTAARGGLSTSDVAAIRSWTGAKGPGPTPATPPPTTGEPVFLEDLSVSDARTELARLAPGVDIDDLADEADEVIDNREGNRTAPFSVSIEEQDDGSLDVTLCTSFDYEGADFSHYTSFSVSDGDYQLTDAGAD